MKEVLGAAQLCGTLPRAITLVGVEALHTCLLYTSRCV